MAYSSEYSWAAWFFLPIMWTEGSAVVFVFPLYKTYWIVKVNGHEEANLGGIIRYKYFVLGTGVF